ncbi:MAG: ATP-grasp fold amidoligase family protein [Clostridium paraputrificum]
MNSILYSMRRKMQVLAFDIFGPKFMSKVYFRIVLKQKLNLKEPKTFNEKIQWYKLNTCHQDERIIICSDKLRVREYLDKKGLLEYQVPLLGDWESTDQIEWDKLPQRFVIKCNHGCAYNIICKDKSEIDLSKVERKLTRWLNESFGKFNAEIHYDKIKPCILCEEYLDNDGLPLVDYKIHCFNGVPKFILICSEREGNKSNYNYYDLNWDRLDYSTTLTKDFKKPDTFSKMLEISKIIAEDFPFVRVDFYDIKGKLMIGELTFVPAGGLDDTLPKKADLEIGNMLNL